MIPIGVAPGDERTAPERWQAIPRRWRALLLVSGAIVAVDLGLSFVGGIVGSTPSGDGSSSSFGTSPAGVAALTQLLAEHGHSIDRSIQPVSETHLAPGSTLFLVDPSGWTDGDTSAVALLIAGGGHAVLAGRPPSDALLSVMFGSSRPPRWQSASAGTTRAIPSTSVVAGVSRVTGGSVGSLVSTGSTKVILAGTGGPFAVAGGDSSSGGPSSVFIASSTFMTNAALAERDNAAFAINLAGPAAQPVIFDEFDHGYGRTGTGLAGLPEWWRWGLALGLAAVVMWIFSAARRFGPVERPTRQLIPPRVEYANAMATTLAALPEDRLGQIIEPLRTEARLLLCQRSGVWTTADDAAVLAAAHAALVPEFVTNTVLENQASTLDVISLGRALAWLETHTGRRT